MTALPAVAAPAQLWSTMPGWGIAADLTPPELINSRELKTLRKWIGAGLVILLLACVGGYVAAARQHSTASAALDKVNAQTFTLEAGVRKYAGVTQIQGSVTQVQAQIATLMSSDVDLVKLMGRLRTSLPAPMKISSEVVTITPLTAAAAPAGAATAAATIGTVTLSGTGRALDDLAKYVDHLQAIPGVVDVNPTSNVVTGRNVVTYSLSLSLTTVLISHRFDVSKTGTK